MVMIIKFLDTYNTWKYGLMKIPVISIGDKVIDIAYNNVVGFLNS